MIQVRAETIQLNMKKVDYEKIPEILRKIILKLSELTEQCLNNNNNNNNKMFYTYNFDILVIVRVVKLKWVKLGEWGIREGRK